MREQVYTQVMTVRLSEEQNRNLVREARRLYVPKGDIVRMALAEFFERTRRDRMHWERSIKKAGKRKPPASETTEE